jgi:hypothetical protein
LEPAYDFILACARYCLDPAQSAAPVFPVGLEPGVVLKLATRQRAVALLYQVGKALPGLLPEAMLSPLRRMYSSGLLMGQLYARQVQPVLAGLHAAGVPVIVFKAWAAFPTVYAGGYGARPSADIDLLISPEQLKKADAQLLALGFQPQMEFWPGYRFRHHITGITYAKAISKHENYFIDLHWGIFTRPYHDDRIRVADFFSRAAPLQVAGEPALQLGIEDVILHACGHLSLHHQYETNLSRLYELAWWIHHSPIPVDWQAVLARTADWKLTIAMQRFAPQVQQAFPNTFPAEFMQALQSRVPDRAELKAHDWLVKYFHTPLSLVLPARWTPLSLWNAVGLLLEAVFPGPRYLEERYGPTRFFPLNYGRRWADLTRRMPGSVDD